MIIANKHVSPVLDVSICTVPFTIHWSVYFYMFSCEARHSNTSIIYQICNIEGICNNQIVQDSTSFIQNNYQIECDFLSNDLFS